MRLIHFPKTIKLELPDYMRQGLDQVLDQHPEIPNDHELLIQVLDDGIAAMNAVSKEPHEPPPTVQSVAERMERRLKQKAKDARAKAAGTSFRPFPKTTRRHKDPRKERVENYIACPLDHALQRRLQVLVDAHPNEGLERLVARLLDLGLDQADQNHGALKTNPANGFQRHHEHDEGRG